MTMPANRTQPSRQMMVDFTSLPSIESDMSRRLNRGRPRLPKAYCRESVECSGGGRLRDVAGQMVFDPAVIRHALSELLPNASNRRLNSVALAFPAGDLGSPRDILRALLDAGPVSAWRLSSLPAS
jgi:hypothetical protein